jgi:MYXO-CTERM domain-containing protein
MGLFAEISRALPLALLLSLLAPATAAALPSGVLVWTKGVAHDAASRKIWRASLPDLGNRKAITTGEDIEPQISPDGRWVAYAKATLPGGTDYQYFSRWSIYLVALSGGHERKIDAQGYWPSWGAPHGGHNVLYYNQRDDKHSKVQRVSIDANGAPVSRETFLSTRSLFPQVNEINECFIARDGSWFAARTRGAVNGVGGYQIKPPTLSLLGQTGDNGCMPSVAPSGQWALLSGSNRGIRWGDAPTVKDRKQDRELIPVIGTGYLAYHPSVSTDERWVVTGQSKQPNHNDGPYSLYIYRLHRTSMKVGPRQLLVQGGFNGWSHIWVDPSVPVPGDAAAPPPRDAGVNDDQNQGGGSGCSLGGQPAAGIGGLLSLLLLLHLASRRRR